MGSVTVTGPFAASGAPPVEETPSRRRIFVCRPAGVTDADRAECAGRIPLESGAPAPTAGRSWRPTWTFLLRFFEEGTPGGRARRGHRDGASLAACQPGVRAAGRAGPRRCRARRQLRDQRPGAGVAAVVLPLEQHPGRRAARPRPRPAGCAIRWCWEQQTRRMLGDERARAPWSRASRASGSTCATCPPSCRTRTGFPDVGEGLRQAMRRETELFVESVFHGDRSVLDLLSADYTFVNERLARHYGMPSIYGSHFRRVPVANEARARAVGPGQHPRGPPSYPNRTSPRAAGQVGARESARDAAPALPPPDVPALEGDDRRRRGALDARGDRAPPCQPGVRELPPG